VLASFRYMESLVVTPFFNLVLVYNTGAAFSFLAGAGGWQKWLLRNRWRWVSRPGC
jgi:signal peptidase II